MSKPLARPDRHLRQVSRQRGLDAESRVALDLQANGWTVIDRNWRGGGGELDLIVQRAGTLRFVEVKHRRRVETEPISPARCVAFETLRRPGCKISPTNGGTSRASGWW
jgi:Holliday junction resolvase-like predicted endonuclease